MYLRAAYVIDPDGYNLCDSCPSAECSRETSAATETKRQVRQMIVAQLEAASREFDRPDYSPRFGKAPASQQRHHDAALRYVKRVRGHPPAGAGTRRIQITVERGLLAEADNLARRQRISRSQLIAHGLRLALAS